MGTILTETSTFTAQVICPNPGEPVSASDSLGTAYLIKGAANDPNGGIYYTATNPLARVRHLGGISQTLLVTVVGTDITIQLGTDGGGNVTSLASAVVAAFSGNALALALGNALLQAAGTAPAGINTAYIAIGQDALGSIRTGLQALSNRTRYIFNKIVDILFGTLSLKSLKVDGTGDVTVVSSAGDISASNDISALGAISADGNIISNNGEIRAITGDIKAFAGDILAITGDVSAVNVNASIDVLATNKIQGNRAQVFRAVGGTVIPSITIPQGEINRGNVICGAVNMQVGAGPTFTMTMNYGINVNTFSRVAMGKYNVVFNTPVAYTNAVPIAVCRSPVGILPTLTFAMCNVLLVNPLTIEILTVGFSAMTGLNQAMDNDFFLHVIAE